MSTIKAIETRYQGYRFRSRLEARWAVFFDALGIKWEYEVQGYHLKSGMYLPDFRLPECKLWVEIKGEPPTKEEIALIRELAYETKMPTSLFHGIPNENPGVLFCTDTSDGSGGENEWEEAKWATDFFGNVCINTGAHADRTFYDLDFNVWEFAKSGSDCLNGDIVQKAIDAAKSARFEHGESP